MNQRGIPPMPLDQNIVSLRADQTRSCAICGSNEVSTTYELEEFPYGHGPDAVMISVRIPIRHCRSCGESFADEDATLLRHEAVCRHLGVLPPRDIRDLRQRNNLSRASFAAATGIGEASLARWETGSLIQNRANDSLLYLLSFPENLTRLSERLLPAAAEPSGGRRFPALVVTPSLTQEQHHFQLRVRELVVGR
jgi:putative zinc finger/helix-turn-helix YgiT family protein